MKDKKKRLAEAALELVKRLYPADANAGFVLLQGLTPENRRFRLSCSGPSILPNHPDRVTDQLIILYWKLLEKMKYKISGLGRPSIFRIGNQP